MIGIRKVGGILIVLLILCLIFIGGCSGTQEPPQDSEETETPEAVEGDGSLDRVLEAGVLTVVGSGGYVPFNYRDESDPDTVVGFDVDVGLEIAKRLGVELNYETSAWDGLPDGLRAGRYDAILGSMADTEARREIISFTVPYYYSGAQLVVNKNSGITDPSEMTGKEVGVVTGETFAEDAEALGATVVYYDDSNPILLELFAERIDGMITDRLVAISAMKEIARGDELMLAGNLLRLETMAIAIKQEDNDLREKLDEILEEMHADGTLTEISMKWFGEDITVK